VRAAPIPLPPDGRRTVVNPAAGVAHETRQPKPDGPQRVDTVCGQWHTSYTWGRTHALRLCGRCYRGRRGEGA
jgi:hypothetical protein